MKTTGLLKIAVLALVLVWLPAIAFANVGIPTLYLTVPSMLIALIIVIPLEAAILRRNLQLGAWPSVGVSAYANITSTLIGFPVASFSQLYSGKLLDFFSSGKSGLLHDLQVAFAYGWVLGDFGGAVAGWVFPVGILLMLVYYFLWSWLFEWLVIRIVRLGSLREKEEPVGKAVMQANAATYMLITFALILLNVIN